MNTYLLTWNPNRFKWESMDADIAALKSRGYFDGRWSCGNTKRISAGDRLFLLRQGREPRGIMAAGYAKAASFADKHWDENHDGEALYVECRFDSILVPEKDGVLALSQLQNGPLGAVNWRTQSSGISVAAPAAALLESLWRNFLNERGLPTPRPGAASAGAGFGNADRNKQVEDAAIRFVTAWHRARGWNVRSVEAENCGFDLFCSKNAQIRNVEVKGVTGEGLEFIVTSGEVRKAEGDPNFLLCVVTRAMTPNPRLTWYSGSEFLAAFILEPIQYRAKLRSKVNSGD